MPELPEVEIVKRGLTEKLLSKKIGSCKIINPNLRYPIPKDIGEKLQDKSIIDISRRSRYICLKLSDSSVLIFHLGMTGKLLVYPNSKLNKVGASPHDNLAIYIESGEVLVYNDIRRFGFCLYLKDSNELKNHKNFKNLGVEPLEAEFSSNYLRRQLASKTAPIKTALMDNSLVVGVGNIYASESLFEAEISPFKVAKKLTASESSKLVKAIKTTLKHAIEAGGSSFSDYVQDSGENGSFQNEFKVYGRTGEPCYKCKSIIQKAKQSGRSSFYCPFCQK
jgi:formamidopyrimidine-DNA glycosylase